MLGELSEKSPDFKDFLNAINSHYKAKDTEDQEGIFQVFDKVEEEQDLKDYIQEKILKNNNPS